MTDRLTFGATKLFTGVTGCFGMAHHCVEGLVIGALERPANPLMPNVHSVLFSPRALSRVSLFSEFGTLALFTRLAHLRIFVLATVSRISLFLEFGTFALFTQLARLGMFRHITVSVHFRTT